MEYCNILQYCLNAPFMNWLLEYSEQTKQTFFISNCSIKIPKAFFSKYQYYKVIGCLFVCLFEAYLLLNGWTDLADLVMAKKFPDPESEFSKNPEYPVFKAPHDQFGLNSLWSKYSYRKNFPGFAFSGSNIRFFQ